MTVSRVMLVLALLAACGGEDDAITVGDGNPSTSTPGETSGGTATESGDSPGTVTLGPGSAGTGTTGGPDDGATSRGGEEETGEPVPFDQLSDEFDDPATLSQWTLRSEAESEADQHVVLDIDTSTQGHLTLVPTTSGWFREYAGLFLYKLVEGDFVVEVWVSAAHIGDPDSAPTELFNSGGILVRDPAHGRERENWLVHNIGRQSPEVGIENKNTINSFSELTLFDMPTHRGLLRICRVGSTFILLRQLEGEDTFTETMRFERPDLPSVLQVGPMANGWNAGGSHPDLGRTPDVRATFDYIRFWQPSGEDSCDGPSM